MEMKYQSRSARAMVVREEFWSLLISKEVWLALVGAIVAICKWAGVAIPMEVLLSIEALIIAVIAVLSKKE